MTPSSVMLFAAGRGTRMAPLTDDRPKPLVEVAGKPLIAHALAQVAGLGLRLVANVHWRADQLRPVLAAEGVLISDESDQLLETGGGLRRAGALLGPGPVFTLNADAVWSGPTPLAALKSAWRPDKMDALLACVPKERAFAHQGRGDFIADAEGRAERGPGLVYTGCSITCTDGLELIEEEVFSLNRHWDRMLARGRLFIAVYPGAWCDVGTPAGIGVAEAMLAVGTP